MSLCVDLYVPGPDGLWDGILDVPGGASDLAGFERWRTVVWGNDAMRALGATYFPRLAGDNLLVPPAEVPAFRRECALVRSGIALIAPKDDPHWTYEEFLDGIPRRLRNIEDAAERAERLGVGVIIW